MKLLLITDAWEPQTNGVVTTLKTVTAHLKQQGFTVEVIHPGLFRTMPLPSYPEIRLSLLPGRKLGRLIREFRPDYVHIATEGSLGLAGKRYLDKRDLPYTTSLHTKFPEYVNERIPLIKVKWGYAFLSWFHNAASSIFVTTKSMYEELKDNGLDSEKMVVWGRGVDAEFLKPDPQRTTDKENPILMYVGRLAVEKNLSAFLDLQLPGLKVLVGDGPQAAELKKRYPDVEFVGYKYGAELVEQYQRADVFVFPSRTDTFGLVMLEAMACGTPVAAYPVAGPVDVVVQGKTGILDDDLGSAITQALQLDRNACREYAEQQSWQAVAQRLHDKLALIDTGKV